jgi:hypothetical protein
LLLHRRVTWPQSSGNTQNIYATQLVNYELSSEERTSFSVRICLGIDEPTFELSIDTHFSVLQKGQIRKEQFTRFLRNYVGDKMLATVAKKLRGN